MVCNYRCKKSITFSFEKCENFSDKKDKQINTINKLNKGNKHLYYNNDLLQKSTITHNVTLYY